MSDLVDAIRNTNIQLGRLVHQVGAVGHDNWSLWETWMQQQWPDLVTAVKKLERL